MNQCTEFSLWVALSLGTISGICIGISLYQLAIVFDLIIKNWRSK